MTNKDKLKPEVKKAWVEALRSGKYKQGHRSLGVWKTGQDRILHKPDAFCCLGVLCEISGQPYEPNQAFPNRDVLQWATGQTGLPAYAAYSPEVKYMNVDRTLSDLNDTQRLSFTEIAKLIEDQL